MSSADFRIQALYLSRTASNNASYLLPYIKPRMKILDVGCGPGSITIDFARLVPQGSVTGVDIAEAQITRAVESLSSLPDTPRNIQFYQADALDLSRFSDNSFDVVHSHQVLLHLPDPVASLKEQRRVLKPGGILAARDCMVQVTYPSSDAIERSQAAYQARERSIGADPEGGRVAHVWAHEAGFAYEKMERSTGSWSCATAEERKVWAGRMGAGRNIADTEVDSREAEKAWSEWAEREDAWHAGLDGCLICWK